MLAVLQFQIETENAVTDKILCFVTTANQSCVAKRRFINNFHRHWYLNNEMVIILVFIISYKVTSNGTQNTLKIFHLKIFITTDGKKNSSFSTNEFFTYLALILCISEKGDVSKRMKA